MKIVVKNRLKSPITALTGDKVRVAHTKATGESVVCAEIDITEPTTFNTAFIAEFEPGEAGAEYGVVGGFSFERD